MPHTKGVYRKDFLKGKGGFKKLMVAIMKDNSIKAKKKAKELSKIRMVLTWVVSRRIEDMVKAC